MCTFTSFSYPFLALLARIFNIEMNQHGDESTWWKKTECIVPNLRGKWKVTVKAKVAQSCPALCDPIDYTAHGILQARILEWVAFPFSRGSSQPRYKHRSAAWQADSLPAEPQGKPKNNGVGSLSFLQQIFPTQRSNQGLLHCRWILYQLNYQGSNLRCKEFVKNVSWRFLQMFFIDSL